MSKIIDIDNGLHRRLIFEVHGDGSGYLEVSDTDGRGHTKNVALSAAHMDEIRRALDLVTELPEPYEAGCFEQYIVRLRVPENYGWIQDGPLIGKRNDPSDPDLAWYIRDENGLVAWVGDKDITIVSRKVDDSDHHHERILELEAEHRIKDAEIAALQKQLDGMKRVHAVHEIRKKVPSLTITQAEALVDQGLVDPEKVGQ